MCKKLLAMILMTITVLSVLSGCAESHTYTEISDYGEFYEGECVVNLSLDIFPATVDESYCNEYIYSWSRGLLDDHCQIFLDCTYDDVTFSEEKMRIQNLDGGFFLKLGEINPAPEDEIVYDEDLLSYPAYVKSYIEGSEYEYAFVFEEENRIVYVGLQWCPIKNVKFDHKYLPLKYKFFTHI